MLEIKDLCYEVMGEDGRTEILKNVTLTIADGAFAAVTGPNGGGKTTLAKAIMGLVQPTAGEILWNGTDITNWSITDRARAGICYGFQQPPRFKGVRVRDLLSLAAGRAELSDDACCQYLTRVGLCAMDYIDREVDSALSGGEVKRIEIATVLARGAGLMIFDEPEAGIDLWSFARLTETFREIHRTGGVTLLIISHQERILSEADEIALLADGTVAAFGPAAQVFPKLLDNTRKDCTFIKESEARRG